MAAAAASLEACHQCHRDEPTAGGRARRRLRIYTGALGIALPTDPDGDKLTVTVQGLPRGLVRFGVTTLRTGDRLEPEQLPALVYVPGARLRSNRGEFLLLVDDGRRGPNRRRTRYRRHGPRLLICAIVQI